MDNNVIENIIKSKDATTLCNLNYYDFSDVLIELVYKYYYNMPFDSMNEEIKLLYSCCVLEDCCQADDIRILSDDVNLFFNMHETCTYLRKINAPKTADALQKFIDLMPTGTFENKIVPEWKWFFEDERKDLINSINSTISNYPDGLMRDLYHKYVSSDIEIPKKLLDIV